MRPVLPALLPALALAGCVAGPDYHMPSQSVAASPAAAQPFASAQGREFSSAPLPDQWWRLYEDPRLDGLVQEALAANTDLRAADANLRRVAAIEASRADEETVRAARDDARIAVAAAVTRAYAGVCAANYSLAANRRVVALQRKTLEATQRLERGGRGTAFDVTRAQAAVDQSEAQLPAFAAQRQADLFLIATLLGRVPADYPKDIAECGTLPALTQPMPVGDGASLIRRRPDIRAAERQLAGDTARVGVAMADLYPQVSISLSGPFKTFGSGDSFGFSLGPLLSWSFPNRPVVKARIAVAGAQAEADLAGFDSTVLGALRETETALSTYARSRDRVAALQKARDSAARAADQAERLFRFGRTDFLQVLDAQRSLANAEASLVSAQTQTTDHQIDIFLALGGGWQ